MTFTKEKMNYPEIITREYIDLYFLEPGRMVASVLNGTMFFYGQEKTLHETAEEAKQMLKHIQKLIDFCLSVKDVDTTEELSVFCHRKYILEKGIARLPHTIFESSQRKFNL